MSVTPVPRTSLEESTPHPVYFGNAENPKGNKHWTHDNWLRSIFHFSFADVHYSDPRRNSFGVLRVMNDDLVQPDRGFGTHPHRDMEIATYIVFGGLTHQDSMGTAETLSRGAVQFMSAGTGIRHSEFNRSATDPLRFIQMWIVPRERGMTPRYGGAAVAPEQRWKQWMHLAADDRDEGASVPIRLNQDVNLHVAEFPEGDALSFAVKRGRQAYVLCVEGGAVDVVSSDAKRGTVRMAQHDAAEVGPATDLEFKAVSGTAHVLIVEMAHAA